MEKPSKPGVKTTEFWVTVFVTVLGMVGPTLLNIYGDTANYPDWAHPLLQVVGALLAGASALGYKVSRTAVKASESKAVTATNQTKLALHYDAKKTK